MLSSSHKNPFVLIGLGAQKSGTSWIYESLASSENFSVGIKKSYHVWDVFQGKASAKKFKLDLMQIKSTDAALVFLMQKYPDLYFSHFKKINQKNGKNILGDFTPLYSSLSSEIITKIKDGFKKHGLDTKFLFTMRDPVDRCISAIRMHKAKQSDSESVFFEKDPDDILLRYVDSVDAKDRTSYEKTLEALDRSVAGEDFFVGVFEDIFFNRNIDQLSKFCGVQIPKRLLQKKRNSSSSTDEIFFSENAKAIAARSFRSTYEYVYREYPVVEGLWGGFRAL